jgi:predicted O-methyltransferase YrrM
VTIKDALRPSVRPLVNAVRRLRYGRFEEMRMHTSGMLRARVYQQLYETITRAPDLDVVEVGAGGGASSIALAWAFQDNHRESKLIVIEKCEGGSRTYYGDYRINYNILTANLQKYGVRDYIRLYPKYLTLKNKDEVLALIDTNRIGGLIHDADGRIDRDFLIFWPLLVSGGVIIIDDFEDKPEFQPISTQSPDGGTKKLRTYRLLNQFMQWGLFETDRIVDGTVFGHKPAEADFGRFKLDECAAIIDQIMAERHRYVD